MRTQQAVVLVVILGAAALQSAYWASVAAVVPFMISECDRWSGAPPGSLLPWPRPPGLATMITEAEPLDRLVCQTYRSGTFLPIAAAITALAGLATRFAVGLGTKRGQTEGKARFRG